MAGYQFEKVLECPSTAGISSAVRSGLGVALLNGTYLNDQMETIEKVFPVPPKLSYILRVNSINRTARIKAFVEEIKNEFNKSATMPLSS